MKQDFPNSMRKIIPQIIHAVAIVVFFMLFIIIYEPKLLTGMMLTGQGAYRIEDMFAFNLSITCAIYLVSMMVTRLAIYLLRGKLMSSYLHYSAACVLEVLVASAFIGLYLVLISPEEDNYFFWFLQSIKALVGIVVYPYVIIAMAYALHDMARTDLISEEGARIKFYDNRHLLKFVTSATSVLYIEAEENYIVVHYQENGISKKVQIRNSMKSLEPLCEKAGFMRVHRSYFLNPRHVTQLRKEKDGFYFADLDSGDGSSIPVSKRYYEQVAGAL